MALYHELNLYRGVNPHLMSQFQTPGQSRYTGFHNSHISDLTRALNRQLPAGYEAWNEEKIEPDLAIIISRTDGNSDQPITVIELLSPTNKIGEGRREYMDKRYQVLRAGLALVEIDYLHETPSPIPGLPVYPQENGSLPYYLAISDPRTRQETEIYQFGIHQPIPTVQIPLLDGQFVPFNFDEAYQFTYQESGLGRRVDYQAEPPRMHRYSAADQAIIRQQMQEIVQHPPIP